jgi:cysteine desulfurase
VRITLGHATTEQDIDRVLDVLPTVVERLRAPDAERVADPHKITPDVVVDLADTGCGDLAIELMRAMRPLQTGQVLQVRALDPGAVADIPAWCKMRQHEFLAGPVGSDHAQYYIRKGGSS